MARPKKIVEPAAPQQSVAEIVKALTEAGQGDAANQLMASLVDGLLKGNKPVQPTPEEVENERLEAQKELMSEHERQRLEPHKWITFNYEGDDDKVETVELFPCGVAYRIQKGVEVPLPISAINVLKMAVIVTPDRSKPQFRNGVKYFPMKRTQRHSFNLDRDCTAEEAAEWRAKQAADARDLVESQDRDNNDALVEAGAGY